MNLVMVKCDGLEKELSEFSISVFWLRLYSSASVTGEG